MAVKTDFTKKVIATIRKIPRGSVATYGQIAALAGKPGAARGVVWILHSSSGSASLPWHRVINSKGQVAFPPSSRNGREQKKRLMAEGVAFSGDGGIDLARFQWKKKPRAIRRVSTPRLFSGKCC